jgi:hypothetical protein
MMTIRHSVLLLCCLGMANASLAQQFYDGYYLTLESDTVRGQIQDNGYIQNSQVCIFRTDEEAKPEEFTANDILSYSLNGESYRARALELTGRNKETVVDVFVRTLVGGQLSLITFNDRSGGQHYYLQDEEHGTAELTVSTRTVDDKQFTDRRYRGVFKLFTGDCSQDLGIDDMPFREKDMVTAVIDFNKCVGYDDVQVAEPTKGGINLQVMGQAGMTYYSPLQFTAVSNVFVLFDEQPDLKALVDRDMQPSIQPTAGINLLISSPKQPNFFFITGVHYNPLVWESSDGVERFEYQMIEIPVLLQYQFTAKRYTKVTPFVQFGFIAPVQLSYSNTNDGIFNLIELEVIDEETQEVERNLIGTAPLTEDVVDFTQLIRIGAGAQIQLSNSKLMLQANYGFQVESNLSNNLLAKSNHNIEFRLGWIPNWF